jgi:anaerobic sulfite reductase subunit B
VIASSDTLVELGPDVPLPYRVVARQLETADVVTLRVQPVQGSLPPFRPAQFAMIGIAGVGEVPVSISSSADERITQSYTVRRAGAVTTRLFDSGVDDIVTIRGPFGRPWNLDRAGGQHAVFVAGGIGLAPLRAAIDQLARRRVADRISVLVGAQTPEDHLYGPWLEQLTAEGVAVLRTVDAISEGCSWNEHVGLVTDLIPLVVDDHPIAAFVCGPDPMMVAVIASLRRSGVAADAIEVTLERNMQCANGWCGHCQLGSLLVCCDGPVVTSTELGRLLEQAEL